MKKLLLVFMVFSSLNLVGQDVRLSKDSTSFLLIENGKSISIDSAMVSNRFLQIKQGIDVTTQEIINLKLQIQKKQELIISLQDSKFFMLDVKRKMEDLELFLKPKKLEDEKD